MTADTWNAAEQAWLVLKSRPDVIERNGPRLEIRRSGWPSGQLSDGTRVFIVTPCPAWRWLAVTLGWNRIAEIDQRGYFERPQDLAADIIRAIDDHTAKETGFREELTAAGPQLVIPGCERIAPDTGKPVQLGLFG
jgi:hypothetical protein